MLRPASRTAHHSPWLPPVVLINSDRGDPSHPTTTGSWIGVDLEVVVRVGLQSILLEAHARFLGLLKMRAAMMRRPGYGHDLMSG